MAAPRNSAAARRRNRWTAYAATAVVAGMVGMAYAAVPLYELFCAVTGFGGTTQRAEAADKIVVGDRVIRVTLDSNVVSELPWKFEPVQRVHELLVGEQKLVYYRATNEADHAITGTASFNVTPHKAGPYFDKVDCFCFTEQTLKPGETVDMPVVFYIDPEIDKDRNLEDVTDIVLSYTFYRAEPSGKDGRQANLTR